MKGVSDEPEKETLEGSCESIDICHPFFGWQSNEEKNGKSKTIERMRPLTYHYPNIDVNQ